MSKPQPKLLSTAWSESGLKNDVPEKRTASSDYGSASYELGFPSETMTPIANGGTPPSGKDMNGVLHDLSAHIVYQNSGCRYRFDPEFAEKNGGYAKGAVVMNDAGDTEYVSLIDGNTSNPNTENRTGKWAIHAGNKLAQLAEQAGRKAVPVGAIFAYDKRMTKIEDWLICDGAQFNATAYPDLYKALGNKNVLPQIPLSDIGMTAFFPVDEIPKGWIAFDEIRSKVTDKTYPKLHTLLIKKYGSIANVPTAEDRFIRNAGNGLGVGLKQEDAMQNIKGTLPRFDDLSDPNEATGAFAATRKIALSPMHMANEQAVFADFDASRVVRTAHETRPKSLVLKLCIKAVDDFTDVVFWIKAKNKAETELDGSGSLNNGGATNVVLSGEYEIKPKYINILPEIVNFAAGESTTENALKYPLADGFFACEWEVAGKKFNSTHFAHVGRTQDYAVVIAPESTQLNFVVANRNIQVNNPTNNAIKLLSVKVLAAQAEYPNKPKVNDDDPEVVTLLNVKTDLQKQWADKLREIRAEKAVYENLKERDIGLVTTHALGIGYQENHHINFFYVPMTAGSILKSYGNFNYDNTDLINKNDKLIFALADNLTESEAREKITRGESVAIKTTFARVDFDEIGNNGYNNARTVYEAHIWARTNAYNEYLTRFTQQEDALNTQMQAQIMRIDAQIAQLKNGE